MLNRHRRIRRMRHGPDAESINHQHNDTSNLGHYNTMRDLSDMSSFLAHIIHDGSSRMRSGGGKALRAGLA